MWRGGCTALQSRAHDWSMVDAARTSCRRSRRYRDGGPGGSPRWLQTPKEACKPLHTPPTAPSTTACRQDEGGVALHWSRRAGPGPEAGACRPGGCALRKAPGPRSSAVRSAACPPHTVCRVACTHRSSCACSSRRGRAVQSQRVQVASESIPKPRPPFSPLRLKAGHEIILQCESDPGAQQVGRS